MSDQYKFDKLHAMIETTESSCELNHGPGTNKQDYPAVDQIVLPIGYKENEITEVQIRELYIPICQECLNGLYDKNWVLIYCLDCLESQWVYKPKAKLDYMNKLTEKSHNIIWLKGCPKCSVKFGGFYCENNNF